MTNANKTTKREDISAPEADLIRHSATISHSARLGSASYNLFYVFFYFSSIYNVVKGM
uniref:Uncharacterized protein n=1 Tax=Anopheles minimus TaxID=112268 RepID=A0A182W0P7_9DIPT